MVGFWRDPVAVTVVGFLTGAVIGFMSGLFAIGGAMVAIPLFGIVFGMDQQMAQGTSLAMVAPNVCLGFWRYAQRNAIHVRTALVMTIAATPMTMIFSRIATVLPSRPLRYAFVVLLIVMVVELLRRSYTVSRTAHFKESISPSILPNITAALLGAMAGAVSGLFGAGGAIVAVALLTTIYGFSQTMAQGVSLAYVAPGTIVSIFVYAAAHDVRWEFAVPLAVGGLLTVTPGVVLAHRLPEARLQRWFAAMLAVGSLALLYRAMRQG